MSRAVVAILLAMTVGSGCLWAPELDRVRKDIERQIPGVEFSREFAISLGPMSIGLLRVIAAVAPVDEDQRGYLDEISKVKVAVYEVDNMPRDPEIQVPDRLRRLLDEKGWDLAVRVHEDEESVWVLYKAEDDEVREMYVLVMNTEELVLVRVEGHLDRLFEKAMNDHFDLSRDLGI